VVVVDQAWARRFFPGQSAVGKRLKGGGCSTCDWTTVVGVVSPVKYDGLGVPDQGVVYTPMAESGEGLAGSYSGRVRFLLLRSAVASSTIVPQVRKAMRDLDPDVPFTRVATIEELADESLQQPRGLSLLVGVLAIVALALSAVGIYGVMAYYVQQQSRDISVRLALGGTPRGVFGLIVRRGMTLVAWGMAAGLAIAVVLARAIASKLFGVGAGDPATLSVVMLVLAAAAAVACGIPAMRAVAVEPAAVLRME
jgi:putative ABC transport system permease protein